MPPAQIRQDGDSSSPVAVSDDTIADEGEDPLLVGGDDDDEAALPLGRHRNAAGPFRRGGGGGDDNEDDGNDDDEGGGVEVQDYRAFAAFVGANTSGDASVSAPSATPTPARNRKSHISSQTIRKGEKDFEEHGTRAQRDALEQSRAVMETVLAHTRTHYTAGGGKNAGSNDVVRGWYFPEAWQDEPEDEADHEGGPAERNRDHEDNEDGEDNEAGETRRRFAHTRHRVVMVEIHRGPMFASVGAVPGKPKWIPTLPKDQQPTPRPGYDRVWLLPEEALFLVERGTMELWWPLREMEAILGLRGSRSDADTDADEEHGIPLSLQAAYALLIGPDDDPQHGRIPLPTYQVYTHLRRSGYQVLRAVKTNPQTPLDAPTKAPVPPVPPSPTSLWQWLFSLLSPSSPSSTIASFPLREHAPRGALVQPGLYRSYRPIYAQLRLIQPHRYGEHPPVEDVSQRPKNPFRIVFHVWKSGTSTTSSSKTFSKIRPPPPDFYMAVADAHATGVPTLEQVSELLASVPPLPATAHLSKRSRLAAQSASTAAEPAPSSMPSKQASAFPPLPTIYRRLKLGRRCVLVAVVDHGLVNYMRFSDTTFSTDPLWPRFDAVAAGRFSAGNGRGARNDGGSKGKAGGGKNQKKKKKKNGDAKSAAGQDSVTEGKGDNKSNKRNDAKEPSPEL
ncbi:tRNA-splicing endonuclease subunit Sen54 [Sporothrix schenckii 1099-18]|uniref:tRNA-splicing endonuclease subunit Sen54 n=1 Tax=Sporothrix schenckii 1099-18 TaxID=1397361 RepID=A0A0F2LZA7_SPOSC|nr:tRNA-splicing endonuclease subunit Sen54 [Sporothrix schenckii 1099-18]KJR82793.1 tRNA-splicing endonuclease subunit Sen54 [Sporothrix schenckii 1099-18]